jgi:nicotinamidase-related amidase
MNQNFGKLWDASECALILIDYQEEMFRAVKSSDPKSIEVNVCTLARAANAFGIPIVLSTVGVNAGVNGPTIDSLMKELSEVRAIDRSSMNAWEDNKFINAVLATKRKRLVFCALWTEICLAYPVVEALGAGYDVCFVADAVGGRSKVEHDTAISRMTHAGAVPNTTFAMTTEWFRDWNSPLALRFKEVVVPYIQEKRSYLQDGTKH